MEKHKKNKVSGITLIALVVTIIVNRVFYDKISKPCEQSELRIRYAEQ